MKNHCRGDDLTVKERSDPRFVQPNDLRLEVGRHVTPHVADWLAVYLAKHSAVVMRVASVRYQFQVVTPEVQVPKRFRMQRREGSESSPVFRWRIKHDSVHAVNSIDRSRNRLQFSFANIVDFIGCRRGLF